MKSKNHLNNLNRNIKILNHRSRADPKKRSDRRIYYAFSNLRTRRQGHLKVYRRQDIWLRGPQVFGSYDIAEGRRIAISRGDAEGDTDVVDGLDVVCGGEGESEWSRGSDGWGAGQTCDLRNG